MSALTMELEVSSATSAKLTGVKKSRLSALVVIARSLSRPILIPMLYLASINLIIIIQWAMITFDSHECYKWVFLLKTFDIIHIQKGINAESIRLNQEDGESTCAWAKKLNKEGSLLGFKAVNDAPPLGSNLAADVLSLMIQTPWQERMYKECVEYIMCIDGT
ncbi:hypothetical protein BDP27DRAFT_1369677 [Rhodocollybia butyracea]|uniref:Uncharacterized protein n=1 Tax=Rhodocollybia butyracea TaxID=206335 RepID=A0A9P5U0G6_9AGAR|nr:hypothetical protein BDP27DRAFT_1369677 [Rhodocollybia butyracea]